MHRLSEPQISPDGKWVAYTVATPNLETNHTSRDIWIVSVAGGEPRQLTHGGSDTRPRWSPDGQKLAFISARIEGNQQVFWIDIKSGEPEPHHFSFCRSGQRNLVAGRKDYRFRFQRLSRLHGRSMQRAPRRRKSKKQSEGAHLRQVALPPLERHGGMASAAIFLLFLPRAELRATSRPARTTMCRPSTWALRKRSPFLPTARKFVLPRTRIKMKRSAQTAIFLPCPPQAQARPRESP